MDLYLLNGHDFPAVVGAAGKTGVMGFLHFLALRAGHKIGGLEVLVRAPFVPAGFGCFVFWICHDGEMLLLSLFIK